MKTKLNLLLLAIVLTGTNFAQNNTAFFKRADLFLKAYTQDGRVNYQALRSNSEHLDWLIDYMAKQPIAEKTRKAYLINAYNIGVINKVTKYSKLVKDPNNISGFFDKATITLSGQQVSLNQIENQMIRPVYKDPRVHFVLVCAGLGCPPIASFAYTPDKLEEQLESQTKLAFNGPSFVYEKADKKTIYLSQIFEWYTSDFGNSIGDAITYINKFRQTPFNTSFKTKFYPYEWTLNNASFSVTEITEAQLKEVMEVEKAEAMANKLAMKDEMVKETITTTTTTTSTFSGSDNSGEIDLQTFTAGSLLGKGKFDFTLFNTVYTESQSNWMGQDFSGFRNTFVTHLAQITYGITESKRINVGLDINFKNSGTSGDSTFAGIAQAFNYNNDADSRVGITSVGARLKLQPFKDVDNFSFQSTFYVPTTINDPEGRDSLYWSDWDRYTWWNQFFVDKTFGKFQLFVESDLLFRFRRRPNQFGHVDIPSSVFLSYFPTKKITVYLMTQHTARFTNNIRPQDQANPEVIPNPDWVIPANWTASGAGFKYQFAPNFNIELLYTNFWRGTNSGLGNTFNIGIKYLTR